jgi:hypothetical protein
MTEAARYAASRSFGQDSLCTVLLRRWDGEDARVRAVTLGLRVEFEVQTLHDDPGARDGSKLGEFGGLQAVARWAAEFLEGRLVIAEADPLVGLARECCDAGLADVLVVPGIELTDLASLLYDAAFSWLREQGLEDAVEIALCEVREVAPRAVQVWSA